jgi:hypothetical protein
VTGSAIWDLAVKDRTMLWIWSAPWPPPAHPPPRYRTWTAPGQPGDHHPDGQTTRSTRRPDHLQLTSWRALASSLQAQHAVSESTHNSVANAELIDCTEATAYAFGHGLV